MVAVKRIIVGTLGILLLGFMIFIVVPFYRGMIGRHNEGETRGNLGSIRSALSLYHDEMHGQYPSDLAALTVGGKYLTDIPNAKGSSHHSDSSAVRLGTNPDDAGGWLYDNVKGDANFGSVRVNCTHTDSRGRSWTSY